MTSLKDSVIASVPQAVKLLRERNTAKTNVDLGVLQDQLAKEQIYVALPLLKIAYEKYCSE